MWGDQMAVADSATVEVDGHRLWGVGIDPSITRATYKAVISAVNRALR